jgi:hypothetical protein
MGSVLGAPAPFRSLILKTIKHLARTWKGIIVSSDADFHFQGAGKMDTLVVFVIIAVAAVYVVRRFFVKKGDACGCGCSGCGDGRRGTGQREDACCGNGERRF